MTKANATRALGAFLLASAMASQSAAVAGPATTCTGSMTGGTYGSIEVPAGASCTLTDVTVTGQVMARPDSALTVFSSDLKAVHGLKAEIVRLFDNTISGNVHIHHGDTNDSGQDIVLEGNTVGGQVHIHHNVGTIRVQDNAVKGHILIQHNYSHLIITDNSVGKNLQVMKTTSSDQKDVTGNAVAGQLHCFDNEAPFTGGPNASAKKVKGDCFVG